MNVKQRKEEKHKLRLRQLLQHEGNRFCFDCGVRGPLYAVFPFYIFVCSTCAAVHRSMQHKVKGISMSEFTQLEVARLTVAGNDRAARVWLARYSGKRPLIGYDRAIRDFCGDVFELRRYVDRLAYDDLQHDLEHALELTAEPIAPASSRRVSPPPAPAPRVKAEADSPAVQRHTATPPVPAPPRANVLDDLFAPAPPASATMAAAAPPVPPSLPPLAPPPPPSAQSATQPAAAAAHDLVASLFAFDSAGSATAGQPYASQSAAAPSAAMPPPFFAPAATAAMAPPATAAMAMDFFRESPQPLMQGGGYGAGSSVFPGFSNAATTITTTITSNINVSSGGAGLAPPPAAAYNAPGQMSGMAMPAYGGDAAGASNWWGGTATATATAAFAPAPQPSAAAPPLFAPQGYNTPQQANGAVGSNGMDAFASLDPFQQR